MNAEDSRDAEICNSGDILPSKKRLMMQYDVNVQDSNKNKHLEGKARPCFATERSIAAR